MQSMLTRFTDDFLDGSVTAYNYFPASNCDYMLYCQIAGIQSIGPHYYNELAQAKEYQVQYTLEGCGCAIIDGEEHILRAGDMLTISNYRHHIFKPVPGCSWKIAFVHFFASETVAKIFERLALVSNGIHHHIRQEIPLPYIKRIITLLREDPRKNEFAISAELYGLLMALCAYVDDAQTQAIDKRLLRVIRYIQNNYNAPITLDDILKESHYSKNHLERCFKQQMHMTIQEYISYLRLQKSQELLLTTDMYCNEIAAQVGLPDYRALNYLFKKRIGITPKEYRQRNKSRH